MDKRIERVDGEYDVYIAGEYVGSRRTYAEAEALANETAYRLLADNWADPKFSLGEKVFIQNSDNASGIIVGMRYAPYRHLITPVWYYQIGMPRNLTSLFNGAHGHEIAEEELSACPWPIGDHKCDGVQHSCKKPACYCDPQWTGSDYETRREVDLFYCPECWAEIQRIDREAREDDRMLKDS